MASKNYPIKKHSSAKFHLIRFEIIKRLALLLNRKNLINITSACLVVMQRSSIHSTLLCPLYFYLPRLKVVGKGQHQTTHIIAILPAYIGISIYVIPKHSYSL